MQELISLTTILGSKRFYRALRQTDRTVRQADGAKDKGGSKRKSIWSFARRCSVFHDGGDNEAPARRKPRVQREKKATSSRKKNKKKAPSSRAISADSDPHLASAREKGKAESSGESSVPFFERESAIESVDEWRLCVVVIESTYVVHVLRVNLSMNTAFMNHL